MMSLKPARVFCVLELASTMLADFAIDVIPEITGPNKEKSWVK